MTPRVAVAVPAFNEGRHLESTLDSIARQTFGSFRAVVVDNRSTDNTPDIARRAQDADARFVHVRCEEFLGLAENWQRALDLLEKLCPNAELFIFAGGHDTWEPGYLGALVAELDLHPAVIGAWARNTNVSSEGVTERRSHGDTFGLEDPRDRLRVFLPGVVVQGLFRASALREVGIARRVLLPDRLILAELSLHGQLKEVPEALWNRRMSGVPKHEVIARQRRTVFGSRAPLHSYAPTPLVHAFTLLVDVSVRGRGGPQVGRAAGPSMAVHFLLADRHLRRRARAVRRRWERARTGVDKAVRRRRKILSRRTKSGRARVRRLRREMLARGSAIIRR